MTGAEEWSELVSAHLTTTGALTGVAVLTKTGTCVHSFGVLADHNQQDWRQFSNLFTDTSNQASGTVPKLSLVLEKEVSFVVFQRTQSSLYATSAGSMYGLVTCSFPLGILVCITEPPTPMSKAVATVENFCTLLRR